MPTKFRLYGALAVTVGLAVAGAIALDDGQARASHVACGDTITVDTTLDSDLVNCPNNGIVIGADDITLDLNDHTITGDGEVFESESCALYSCDVGLLNNGHNGVTVRDGSVREFEYGAFIERVVHNRVLGMSWSSNPEAGLLLSRSRDVRIEHSSFRRSYSGISIDRSNGNLIKGNLTRNSDYGIFISGDRNRVRDNRSVRNGTGITVGNFGLDASQNVIARNRLSHDGNGISTWKGRGNLITRNVVVGAHGEGIELGIDFDYRTSANHVVRRNLVKGSGRDGFVVIKRDKNTLLRDNVAIGAGRDGFDIDSRSTTLTSNRAARNAHLGIKGNRGLIDGGRNIARGNGDPRQCTFIPCG